jgi:hypothetical protein
MPKIDININGHQFSATVRDIVSFLEDIDAQEGTVEESGYTHCVKDKINITERNGMKWWSPLSADMVRESIEVCGR